MKMVMKKALKTLRLSGFIKSDYIKSVVIVPKKYPVNSVKVTRIFLASSGKVPYKFLKNI